MEESLKLLNVKSSAIELISMIRFLFDGEQDKENLLRDCNEMNGQEINKYVYNKRRQIIQSVIYYEKAADFIDEYNDNPKVALERLFREPLSEARLSKLDIDDPQQIWDIHRKQKPDIRFMKFLLLL